MANISAFVKHFVKGSTADVSNSTNVTCRRSGINRIHRQIANAFKLRCGLFLSPPSTKGRFFYRELNAFPLLLKSVKRFN